MKTTFKHLSILALLVAMCLLASGCIHQDTPTEALPLPAIDQLVLGESHTDLQADIKVLTFRTDIMDKLNGYAAAFHELYPGINVIYEGVDDYEKNMIMYLTSNVDWGDMAMIPLGIEKDAAAQYFAPLGSADTLKTIYNYTGAWTHEGTVYGLASTGNANGLIYNKHVFAEAGVHELPTTPDAFIAALTAIREHTDAIPLYTNYADVWPMSCWDAYFGINATGSAAYVNQTLVHAAQPFSDHGDGTHPYAVYKILYDAVANGLTEDDYTTTNEPLSYSMLNEGQIGVLALSSWGVVPAMDAGDHPEDVGIMPFPITVDGKQYVSINGDYSYGVNAQSSYEEQLASMLYIKWLIHESGFDYSEGGLSVLIGGKSPDFYDALNHCVLLEDETALAGEELLFGALNTETGLLFNANGNAKGQAIVEHAFAGTKSFNEIMDEWNARWAKAQEKLNISVTDR